MENQNPNENKNCGKSAITIIKVKNKFIYETIFIFERKKYIPTTSITKALKSDGIISVKIK